MNDKTNEILARMQQTAKECREKARTGDYGDTDQLRDIIDELANVVHGLADFVRADVALRDAVRRESIELEITSLSSIVTIQSILLTELNIELEDFEKIRLSAEQTIRGQFKASGRGIKDSLDRSAEIIRAATVKPKSESDDNE